jgi:hypothetical protein
MVIVVLFLSCFRARHARPCIRRLMHYVFANCSHPIFQIWCCKILKTQIGTQTSFLLFFCALATATRSSIRFAKMNSTKLTVLQYLVSAPMQQPQCEHWYCKGQRNTKYVYNRNFFSLCCYLGNLLNQIHVAWGLDCQAPPTWRSTQSKAIHRHHPKGQD